MTPRSGELGYSGVALPLRRWGETDRFRSGQWHQRAVVLVVAWAALTGLLIAAGVGVVHSSSVNGFDRHVNSVVVAHRTPALNEAMKAVTWLGSWVALVATGSVLVVLALRRRLPMVAVVLAVIAWAGESGGVTLAKHVVERDRPPQELRLVSGARLVVAVGSHCRRPPSVHHLGPCGGGNRPKTELPEGWRGYWRRCQWRRWRSRGLSWVYIGLPTSSQAWSSSARGWWFLLACSLPIFARSPWTPRQTEATRPGSPQAPSGCVRQHTGPATASFYPSDTCD